MTSQTAKNLYDARETLIKIREEYKSAYQGAESISVAAKQLQAAQREYAQIVRELVSDILTDRGIEVMNPQTNERWASLNREQILDLFNDPNTDPRIKQAIRDIAPLYPTLYTEAVREYSDVDLLVRTSMPKHGQVTHPAFNKQQLDNKEAEAKSETSPYKKGILTARYEAAKYIFMEACVKDVLHISNAQPPAIKENGEMDIPQFVAKNKTILNEILKLQAINNVSVTIGQRAAVFLLEGYGDALQTFEHQPPQHQTPTIADSVLEGSEIDNKKIEENNMSPKFEPKSNKEIEQKNHETPDDIGY